jgi:hypothetical protein
VPIVTILRGVTTDVMTSAVLAWVERNRPGARVADCTTRPMAGGTVAARIDQVTLHLADGGDRLELVRKQVPQHEIAGLRAAQAVRITPASAVPELVAADGGWLMTPLAPGSAMADGDAIPPNLFDTLAALHARYQGGADLPAAIPRVTPAWWQALCRDWVDPPLRSHDGRHPQIIIKRARALVDRASGAGAILDELTPTLLHGDVHHANVMIDGDRATLVDWGSSRIGPAALDLANLVTADSASVGRYRREWQRFTGQPLPAAALDLGYRWAALQIPVQYLPWTAGHRSTREVEASLDSIEGALGLL